MLGNLAFQEWFYSPFPRLKSRQQRLFRSCCSCHWPWSFHLSLQVRSLISAHGKGVSGVLHSDELTRHYRETHLAKPFKCNHSTGKKRRSWWEGKGRDGEVGGRLGWSCAPGFITSLSSEETGPGDALYFSMEKTNEIKRVPLLAYI